MVPWEMAEAVAAIMTAFPAESPSAVIDRLCNTLDGLVMAPQWKAIHFSIQFTMELHRKLCEFLFRDIEASCSQLDRVDNIPWLRSTIS